MLAVTNTSLTSGVGSATYVQNPGIVTGDRTALFLWCCSARSFADGTGTPAVFQESTRTATTCYLRGLKEKIAITTNDGCPWFWRRILVSTKNINYRNSTTGAGNAFSPYFYGSSGYQRMINQPVVGGFYDDGLWKGTQGADWNDFVTAPVDGRRNRILYDKTMTIAPGSSQGTTRNYNRWHNINKSIVYDDDENGGGENATPWSVTDNRGIGDVYVIDIFQSGAGRQSGNASQLYFRPEATLYWHER